MEVEILTTKKKLTKSIVNQMRGASTVALKFGTALGYLINVQKGIYKTILIRYDSNFFVIPNGYTKGEASVYLKVGRWSQRKSFGTSISCDDWWDAYQDRIKEAVNQIYI